MLKLREVALHMKANLLHSHTTYANKNKKMFDAVGILIKVKHYAIFKNSLSCLKWNKSEVVLLL